MKHIFIDFNNIKTDSLTDYIAKDECYFWLFIGKNNIISMDFFNSLLSLAFKEQVKTIQSGEGINAGLNPYLTYHLGKLILTEPLCQIKIITTNSLYLDFIQYLKNENPNIDIECHLVEEQSVNHEPIKHLNNEKTKIDQLQSIKNRLKNMDKTLRPKSKKALVAIIKNWKYGSEHKILNYIIQLEKNKCITINSEKVTYHL